jgi:hypothetical protein
LIDPYLKDLSLHYSRNCLAIIRLIRIRFGFGISVRINGRWKKCNIENGKNQEERREMELVWNFVDTKT